MDDEVTLEMMLARRPLHESYIAKDQTHRQKQSLAPHKRLPRCVGAGMHCSRHRMEVFPRAQ
eukprot:CAMPEP_0184702700 /NCGR_PEP_ID=MMETSP0313-20130426/25188_1 /TAXON_ID=2792 /ORGANISM="Porphyridium aerugineum, Strain SAG 1380-2" /LENGTH=61 /DNA_ID=CAMNT_0027163255 /DNA_START=8 /DNA_END=193 /DNA_ORIENTATION=+